MARNPPKPTTAKRRPSFFKIMIGDFANILRIPPAFAKRFEAKLIKNEFSLKDPTWNSHFVKVIKIEDGFFFEDGWPRFVQNNSLESGDLLIFTYIGNSKFVIKIYDTTGCEKDTSLANKNSSQSQHKKENREGERRGTEPVANQIDEIQKTSAEVIRTDLEKHIIHNTEDHLITIRSRRKSKRQIELKERAELNCKAGRFSAHTETEVILVSSDSESEDWMNHGKSSVVSARDADEKVESHGLEVGCTNKQLEVRRGGLRSPINQLPRGSAKKRWHSITIVSEDTKERAIKAHNEFKSKNLFCTIIISSYCLHKGFMSLPGQFSKCLEKIFTGEIENNIKRFNVLLRNLDGSARYVTLTCSGGRAGYLCSGWRAFVEHNNLKEGDVCILELTNTEELEIKVHTV